MELKRTILCFCRSGARGERAAHRGHNVIPLLSSTCTCSPVIPEPTILPVENGLFS